MFCLSLFSQFDDPNEPVVGSCFTLMSRLLCRMMSIEKRFFIMAPTREDELNVSFLESWLSNLGCQTWGVVLSHDNYSKSVFESYNALHHLIFCCAVCLLYYYIGLTQVKCRLLISSIFMQWISDIFWKCWNLIHSISEKCPKFIA